MKKRTKRPRFARQPHDYSCGPTAILNAMKWVGIPASLRCDYNTLVDLCEAEPNGTAIPAFDRVLRENVESHAFVRRKYRPTLREVEKWIKDPACIVALCYWHDNSYDSDGHYMLMTEVSNDGKEFNCINDGKTSMFRDREKIKMYLRNRRRAKNKLPVAWFICNG